MWFRRDLRLSDNPALIEAVRPGGPVVPLFVLDDRLWEPAGAARRAFLVGCLRELDQSIGGHLVVRRGRPEHVVPDVAREVRARQVFAAEDFGPYGRTRDERVEARLRDAGASLERVGSPYAVPPGSVRTAQRSPYRVFTPYRRAWLAHGWPAPAATPPDPRWWSDVRSDALPDAPAIEARLPPPGEGAARQAARRFLDGGLTGYAERRNDPAGDATSRLSPYLKWGCLHPRQLLAGLDRDDEDAAAYRTELCWRDFYADVLFHDPASARRAWNEAFRDIEVDTGPSADERFAAWAAGRTGYPLVDAGMRQLEAEAWMHNRVRMLVASFLVKDLHIDWRRGARFFLHHLVDGDLASNNHGWQWVAGTGTDPSPFVRVFNPVTQARRFDPDGTYVRRYVPELRQLGREAVHEPWRADGGLPDGYPGPIVDHADERLEALRRYDALPRPTPAPPRS